ncbi:hypothetical protein [Vibrio taketomensis]|nr:hypothetical protein [Vibrio taketomensis]
MHLTAQKYAESEFGAPSVDEQEEYFSDETVAASGVISMMEH